MKDVVVDSSVVAKWILPEADSDQADRLMANVVFEGRRLIVLEIGVAEVANAIWKRHHRGLASPSDVRRFLASLLRSPVHVEPISQVLASAMEIAMKFDRAVYDAMFVAAAPSSESRESRLTNPCIRPFVATSRKSSCCGTGQNVVQAEGGN